jgi:hypothetical protein
MFLSIESTAHAKKFFTGNEKNFGETVLNSFLTITSEKDKMDCISKIQNSSLIKATEHTFLDPQNLKDSLNLIGEYPNKPSD